MMNTHTLTFRVPRWSVAPRLRAWIALLLAGILLVGVLPVQAQGGSPSSARLSGLRHTYQTWNNCSGANLTMALSYFGWSYDQEEARAWLKPNVEDKNVSPKQMVDFVNVFQTALPDVKAIWRYGGDMDIIKALVSAGFPVVIESGFDVDDLGWMGHYETVVAYDDTTQTVWVYDSYLGLGDGTGMTHSYAELLYWWKHFNYAYIVLFPLDREAELREVLGPDVDPTYATEQALSMARADAAADVTDSWAWFNMGTSLAKLGDYYDAATAFDEAFRQGMPYRATWYIFEPFEAYYRTGRYDDVESLVTSTEATTEYVEETRYWRGMVYAARGQYDLAINEFNKALVFNPHFTPASDALTAVTEGTFVP